MKKILTFLVCVLAIPRINAQKSMNLGKSMKLISQAVSDLEEVGYSVQKIVLGNNRLPDGMEILADPKDTTFVQGIVIVPYNHRGEEFSPRSILLSVSQSNNSDNKSLEEISSYKIVNHPSLNATIYSWNYFLLPDKKSDREISIVGSHRIVMNELTMIDVINQQSEEERRLSEEFKRKFWRQNVVITFSRKK